MSAAPPSPDNPPLLRTTAKHKGAIAAAPKRTAAKSAGQRQQVAQAKAMPQDQYHKGREGLNEVCMDKWVGWGR